MEICLDNTWGTVCYDSWGKVDATVVCRQLGYSAQGKSIRMWVHLLEDLNFSLFFLIDAVAFRSTQFGISTGSVYLDNVDCSGSESNLIDCPRSTAISCSSYYAGNAGVRCQGTNVGNYTSEILDTLNNIVVFVLIIMFAHI